MKAQEKRYIVESADKETLKKYGRLIFDAKFAPIYIIESRIGLDRLRKVKGVIEAQEERTMKLTS